MSDLIAAIKEAANTFGFGVAMDEAIESIRADAHAAGIKEGERREREATLKDIAVQIKTFQSEEYATPQPMGSFSEVFACNSIAAAIRARNTGGEGNG